MKNGLIPQEKGGQLFPRWNPSSVPLFVFFAFFCGNSISESGLNPNSGIIVAIAVDFGQ